ncbi:aryl-alcohol dehydrogenase-like predicted oxidoreductase [Arthrobacter silviterrae]|uniref:Aldo/keto reductase n=1 Tax=Arthrobacter silviterrae TaxID=2026658 RepID=A0ABX0DEN9_9MICC|nr:aldo/keto reductase [Arthrobacter silviterrae]MDQ0276187.1 aryl-alcohol dehydrogenase-like predicted oxidoreductase [Arthrobacter silviterrae]NGN82652.1 aldo/keto reductase [Arthrobacter silviterrae]
MEQRFVGTSGLRVSALALGTMTWGRETDEEAAKEQLCTFMEAGGTTVDTAVSYVEGRSEAILGELLGDVVPRSDVVLVSKAGVSHRNGKRMVDTSRRAMLASLDATLARLGTDHLDLWLAHIWDENVPLEETLSALDLAVSTGRARYAGVSNYSGWQLARAATLSDTALVANQVEYSLLSRGIEREVLPAAEHVGSGVMCWAPLGRGVLTGKYRGQIPADSRGASEAMGSYVEPYLKGRPSRITEALVTAAKGLGRAPLDVALSWVLDQQGVAGAVVGPRTPAQLESILASSLEPLPEQISAVLDEVSHP